MGYDKITPEDEVLEFSDESDIELDDGAGELIAAITDRVIEGTNFEITAEHLENPQILLQQEYQQSRAVIIEHIRRQDWARIRTQIRDRVRERIEELERRLEAQARAQAEADRYVDVRDPRAFNLARASGSGVAGVAGRPGTGNSQGEPANMNLPGTPYDPSRVVVSSDEEDEEGDI